MVFTFSFSFLKQMVHSEIEVYPFFPLPVTISHLIEAQNQSTNALHMKRLSLTEILHIITSQKPQQIEANLTPSAKRHKVHIIKVVAAEKNNL